jgi:hypothetical protein
MFEFFSKKTKKDENLTAVSILPQSITESPELELRDILAPSALKVNVKELNLGEKVVRSFFVISYPRYLSEDWFAPIINMDKMFDISIFVHPLETSKILRGFQKLKYKVPPQTFFLEPVGVGHANFPNLDKRYLGLGLGPSLFLHGF